MYLRKNFNFARTKISTSVIYINEVVMKAVCAYTYVCSLEMFLDLSDKIVTV